MTVVSTRASHRLAALFLALAFSGCSTVWQARFLSTEQLKDLDSEVPFLKCHTPEGHLYVLVDWSVDENRSGSRELASTMAGTG